MAKKRALGRGLDGLLPPAPTQRGDRPAVTARIEELRPNRGQPRRHFDDDALTELADSIREHGVLEPILVRESAAGEAGFEIIAGERRWRAAQRAGLREVPIFVRELGDAAAFEAALVENLQREDLNPIETAHAFQRLAEEFGHTQEEIAKRVGKDRSSIANALRLLKLPAEVQGMVQDGRLSEGHGRALLGCSDVPTMTTLARQSASQKLSVREVERRARGGKSASSAPPKAPAKSANVRDLERRLSHHLGANVSIESKARGGALTVRYHDLDELDAILSKLGLPS